MTKMSRKKLNKEFLKWNKQHFSSFLKDYHRSKLKTNFGRWMSDLKIISTFRTAKYFTHSSLVNCYSIWLSIFRCAIKISIHIFKSSTLRISSSNGMPQLKRRLFLLSGDSFILVRIRKCFSNSRDGCTFLRSIS